MCMSKPKIPPPPPPPQEQKLPDTMSSRRSTRKAGYGPSTLLTGPSGIASGGLNTGGSTLLGG